MAAIGPVSSGSAWAAASAAVAKASQRFDTATEAAVAATSFMPKVVYPYHFRYPYNVANDNPHRFALALKGSGIRVKLLDFYSPAAIAKSMRAAGQ